MILQEMNGNGHYKILPTPTVLVAVGEAITSTTAVIQLLIAVTLAQLSVAVTMLGYVHHFINVNLYPVNGDVDFSQPKR